MKEGHPLKNNWEMFRLGNRETAGGGAWGRDLPQRENAQVCVGDRASAEPCGKQWCKRLNGVRRTVYADEVRKGFRDCLRHSFEGFGGQHREDEAASGSLSEYADDLSGG